MACIVACISLALWRMLKVAIAKKRVGDVGFAFELETVQRIPSKLMKRLLFSVKIETNWAGFSGTVTRYIIFFPLII